MSVGHGLRIGTGSDRRVAQGVVALGPDPRKRAAGILQVWFPQHLGAVPPDGDGQ